MERIRVILKKVVAVLIAFVIIMSQYVVTGLLEITYAIDLLATQSNNVQFRAYFISGDEELTEIDKSINAKDLKLKIDVAVKNEGYFSGQISLENAGFKITRETANNYINKVENNVIYLNQINADETANIEVVIEYVEEERIEVSTLSEETMVKLTGRYTGSGGNVEINSSCPVKVIWKIPEATKAELSSMIQTNNTYRVGEENKRVVQFLISSQLTDNGYPIKSTEITATKPEGATRVEVHKRTTRSTNGDEEFVEADNVRQEGNNVIIKVENNEREGRISWFKGVNDIFVVTYEYPENIDLSTQSIQINSKITTYSKDKTTGNNIELNGEQVELQLNGTKDGIASVIKKEKESQIYKGKIYSGEDREFTSYTLAYIDYVEGIKEIEITEEETKYAKEVEENGEIKTVESDANVEIKSIKIRKQEVERVLGETWSITIGETTITNETEVDANGNIEVTLPYGTKEVAIKTSKPVNNGFFVIETKKTIKNTTHTREEKKGFTILEDNCSIKYIKNDDAQKKYTFTYKIGLKDTESKASVQSEQRTLIASDEMQPLNFTVVLESKGEYQDLYKNPTIKIKLPNQIENVTFTQKPDLMYANNALKIEDEDYTIGEENGQKVVNIKLTGEQINYLGEAIQGITVLVKTNVKVKNNIQDSEEEIVLNYTNENATKYTDNGIQKANVQILANPNQNQNQQQNGNQNNENENNTNTENNNQVQTSEIKMELTEKVGGESINNGDTVRAGEIIAYTAKITNTGNTDKTGISIETTIPENTTLIIRNPKYPRERFEAEDSIESISDDYFIEQPDKIIKNENIKLSANQSIEFKYLVKTNSNITQDTSIELSSKLKYGDKENILKIQNNLSKSSLVIDLIPITRTGEEEIKAGYGCLYKIDIKNISNEAQKNVRITINKNELINILNKHYVLRENLIEIDNDDTTLIIDNIDPDSTFHMEIESTIKPYTEDVKNANMYITATDNLGIKYRSNLLSEPVGGIRINATLTQKSGEKTSGYVKNGDAINYEIKLENIGEEDAKELTIKDRISQYVDIQSITINDRNCDYIEGIERENEDKQHRIITINSSLPKRNELTIKIKCVVKNDISEKGTLSIENQAFISEKVKITETEKTVYYLENIPSKDNSNNNNNNNNNDNNNNEDNNSQNDSSETNNNESNNSNKCKVSGVVWKDENKNGKREQNEELINGIQVYAINTTTNSIAQNGTGNKIISETNTNGEYILSNLEKGQYLIVFEFNTNKYSTTEYRKEGVSEDKNSDAVKVSKIIEGEEKNVAITDSINLEANYSNIDLGLIEKTNDGVQIKKTVSKITVTNKEGTKKYNYKNAELAKVEIAPKHLNGSKVVIEYSIKIKNLGSNDVIVKNIVDYLPSSLTFTSSLNKEWYKKDNYLYNSSLSNTTIKSGETKEVKLIVTKKMTATNTGLINNKAKIESLYSKEGIELSNNETGSADVIISVKTGDITIYALFILIIMLIMLETAYIVRRFIIKMERR